MNPGSVVSLGAGRMGRSIALAYAYAGEPFKIVDLKPRSAGDFERLRQDGSAEVRSTLALLASFGLFDAAHVERIADRVSIIPRGEAPAVLSTATIAFEAVPEMLEHKREALAFACRHILPNCIVASTTSSILVTTLAPVVTQAQRFLNAHWLNPAFLVPLVELSPHPGTDVQVVSALKESLERIGKIPIVCRPAPGYVVPRLQALIMNEAARMVEEGISTPEQIDRAVRYGFGFRYATMGVMEFIDFGGVDILYHAARYFADTLGERYASPAIVAQKVHAGERGLREGRGFYDWSRVDAGAYRAEALRRQAEMLRYLGLFRPPNTAAA